MREPIHAMGAAFRFVIPVLAGLLLLVRPTPAAPPVLEVDFARPLGPVRALHGINKGPLPPGGLLDLTAEQKALGIPYTRLHDCHWPNPDVVDIHAVFPNPDADPEKAESYDFRLTDEYLAAVQATGARMVYRLGESIEHTSVKRWVHPPKDPEKWARVCLGIIRHYNEGWANGFSYGIRYWEIWNEPENHPACWTGTDEEYFRLYRVTAKVIKERFPELKVGGPAVGNSGQLVNGVLQPSEFVRKFLDVCHRERLPLDFFSWHGYTDKTQELVTRAREIRKLLDRSGFPRTESHLNEWNYLPGGSWEGLSRTVSAAARQKFYQEMAGPAGAAFITGALLELQDAPVDVSNLFHGEVGGFGLFNEHGVPLKSYHAVRAFQRLRERGGRVRVGGAVPGQVAAGAVYGETERHATLLISAQPGAPGEIRVKLANLPWQGLTRGKLHVLDQDRDLEPLPEELLIGGDGEFTVRFTAPAVLLLELRPGSE